MQKTLGELASLLDGELIGDKSIVIKGLNSLKEAKAGEISFLSNTRYSHLLESTLASAVVTSLEVKSISKPIIRTKDPSLAFSKLVTLFCPTDIKHPNSIDKKAYVSKKAKIAKKVGIGPFAVVEDEACIGEGTSIYSGCYIGRGVKIGRGCIIYPNVSIREKVEIGNNVVVQSGTVIGSEGFGFTVDNGARKRIPQVGTVVIEDGVEIGANVTIDRARFEKTIIGQGTKIDNLVQIAHNVIIGKDSVIVALVGISGSVQIGNNVIIAGQAGLGGHITVGDNALIYAQAGVTKDIKENAHVSGYPARDHIEAKRIYALTQRLPRLYKEIQDLQERIAQLEKNSGERKSG